MTGLYPDTFHPLAAQPGVTLLHRRARGLSKVGNGAVSQCDFGVALHADLAILKAAP